MSIAYRFGFVSLFLSRGIVKKIKRSYNNAKEYFDNIIDFTKKDYSIIVNPVNPNFIIDRFEGKRKKEIVSVGRLQEQKNYALLIEAFNDIKDDLKGDSKPWI